MLDGAAADIALLHQPVAGKSHGDKAAGNRGGTGTAVALDHIAVDGDGALAQQLHIDGSAEAAADQTLDLSASARQLQLVHIAAAALAVGAGQHRVLRRDPAAAGLHVGRHALLHRGAAQHHGIAALDQHAAFSELDEVGGQLNGAQFIKFSSVSTVHNLSPFQQLRS